MARKRPGKETMFEKRHRITLLFNANKAYDRQVVEG
jgi:LacI family transcriptional regulator